MTSEHNISELFLFDKVKKGDKESFKFFFEAYYSDLCNYVNLFIRNESLSEEIVQDVYIYLWNNREKINIGKSVRAYLFVASKNKILNHIRDTYRIGFWRARFKIPFFRNLLSRRIQVLRQHLGNTIRQ